MTDTSILANLIDGKAAEVRFLTPTLSTGCAALSLRHPIKQRLTMGPEARTYARTVGLQAVLDGEHKSRLPTPGSSYSRLTKLDGPEAVEASSKVIVDFLQNAIDHEVLLARIGRVVGELHDNVASHAKGVGFSAAQCYQNTLNFSISDCGVGLLRNATKADSSVTSDLAAIKWCLTRGNTSAGAVDDMAQLLPEDAIGNPYPASVPVVRERSANHHLGEGMWQMAELVKATRGSLLVWTGSAQHTVATHGSHSTEAAAFWPGLLLNMTLPLSVDPDKLDQWTQGLEELAEKLGL